jgi:sialidase-1
VSSSADDGKTWSTPKDITVTAKDPGWGWYATGPGIGIQIKHGPHKGRLVIPCDHSYDAPGGDLTGSEYEYGAHVIFSDDHGQTWKLGGTVVPKMNECQVVEQADGNGTLLLNMRSYFGKSRRAQAVSKNGGMEWTHPVEAVDLVEPVCQAALIRYSWPDASHKGLLLFSNPASTKRENMTIKISEDEGRSWPVSRTLYEGPSAYSALAVLEDGTVLCLFEKGEKGAYEKISLARVDMDWIRGK